MPALTRENHWYLNQSSWIVRWVLYFAIWGVLDVCAADQARRSCRTRPSAGDLSALPGLSGIGSGAVRADLSFAAVDWVMSLDPHWGSTIYGFIFLVGQGLSALVLQHHHADGAHAL